MSQLHECHKCVLGATSVYLTCEISREPYLFGAWNEAGSQYGQVRTLAERCNASGSNGRGMRS